MITIDALYLLLLMESVVVLAAAAVYFVLRSRKYAALYRSVASGPPEESPKEQAAAALPPPEQDSPSMKKSAPGETEKELEASKSKISALEKDVKEKTGQLNALQVKFDDLEKEYLILYHQQQAQEQQNKD